MAGVGAADRFVMNMEGGRGKTEATEATELTAPLGSPLSEELQSETAPPLRDRTGRLLCFEHALAVPPALPPTTTTTTTTTSQMR